MTAALAIFIAAFISGASPASASIAPRGTVLLSGGSWLGGSGVNVYSNGGSTGSTGYSYTYTPSGAKVITGYKWQCVELINRLYFHRGWISSYWSGNGGEKYDTAPNVGLKRQPNGSISYLRPGDVVVLQKSGTYGHAAVVERISPTSTGQSVRIVNQNLTGDKVYTYASYSGGRLTSPWSTWSVRGVVHRP